MAASGARYVIASLGVEGAVRLDEARGDLLRVGIRSGARWLVRRRSLALAITCRQHEQRRRDCDRDRPINSYPRDPHPIISPQSGLAGGSDLDEQRVIVEPDRRSPFGDGRNVLRRDLDDQDAVPL
jgi:hypothetical protein